VIDKATGEEQRATMVPGPNGMAVAMFPAFAGKPAFQQETEIPNILLEGPAAMKRPAAASGKNVKKRKTEAPKDDEFISSSPQQQPAPIVHQQLPAPNLPALTNYANSTFYSAAWGSCKVEYYSKKSYIRFKDTTTNKWVLLLGSECPLHKQVMKCLVPKVRDENLSKDQLRDFRNQLQAAEDID